MSIIFSIRSTKIKLTGIRFGKCLQFKELLLVLLSKAFLKIRVGNLFETQAEISSLMDTLNEELFKSLVKVALPKVFHTVHRSLRQHSLLVNTLKELSRICRHIFLVSNELIEL